MNRDAALVGGALVIWLAFVVYWWSDLVSLSSTSLILGAVLVVIAVLFHYATGTGWEPADDISQDVLEHRAETVPQTDFPEPYNRSIGGGGAVAVGAGGAEGELAEGEEGEEADAGFDPDAIPEDEIEVYEIEFEKEGETIEVANNQNILEAGEEEGWDLPYACREGQCLSCAGHVVDGPATDYIRHANNEMLDEDELSDGYCLTCTACPIDDFTIETSESP